MRDEELRGAATVLRAEMARWSGQRRPDWRLEEVGDPASHDLVEVRPSERRSVELAGLGVLPGCRRGAEQWRPWNPSGRSQGGARMEAAAWSLSGDQS